MTSSALDQVRNEPNFNQDVRVNVSGTIGEATNNSFLGGLQALGNLVTDRVVCERLVALFNDIHRSLRQDTARKAAAAILPFLARAPKGMTAHGQWA